MSRSFSATLLGLLLSVFCNCIANVDTNDYRRFTDKKDQPLFHNNQLTVVKHLKCFLSIHFMRMSSTCEMRNVTPILLSLLLLLLLLLFLIIISTAASNVTARLTAVADEPRDARRFVHRVVNKNIRRSLLSDAQRDKLTTVELSSQQLWRSMCCAKMQEKTAN